jgi:hypothetical protein
LATKPTAQSTPKQPAIPAVLIPETIAPNALDLIYLLGRMEAQYIPGAAALASQHVRGLLRELEDAKGQLANARAGLE